MIIKTTKITKGLIGKSVIVKLCTPILGKIEEVHINKENSWDDEIFVKSKLNGAVYKFNLCGVDVYEKEKEAEEAYAKITSKSQ